MTVSTKWFKRSFTSKNYNNTILLLPSCMSNNNLMIPYVLILQSLVPCYLVLFILILWVHFSYYTWILLHKQYFQFRTLIEYFYSVVSVLNGSEYFLKNYSAITCESMFPCSHNSSGESRWSRCLKPPSASPSHLL